MTGQAEVSPCGVGQVRLRHPSSPTTQSLHLTVLGVPSFSGFELLCLMFGPMLGETLLRCSHDQCFIVAPFFFTTE